MKDEVYQILKDILSEKYEKINITAINLFRFISNHLKNIVCFEIYHAWSLNNVLQYCKIWLPIKYIPKIEILLIS